MVRGLTGRFTAAAALRRLLAGTGCGFRFLDQGAVDVFLAEAPPPRIAAKAAAGPPASAAELIVVATRRATAADRLAYPVSVVEGGELTEQGIEEDRGLANVAPAMVVTNLGVGRDKVLLRGLSDGPLTGRTQSVVGIYLDDMRLTYNAPDPDLKLVDVERVEVLRGPQGALYGSGSLGGVVHVMTAPPDRRTASAWVSASAALTADGAPSQEAEGVLNLPTGWRGGALRLVGYHEIAGGYIDDPALGLHDVNRTHRDGARATFDQAFAADWTLRLRGVAQSINADDTQYATGDVGPLARRNRLREPHDNDFSAASVSVDGRLSVADVHGSVAMVRHVLHSTYDATASPPTTAPPGPVALDDVDVIDSTVAEGTLSSRTADRTQWLLGAFYAHTRQGTGLRLNAASGAIPLQEHRRDVLDEAALFGEIRAPLGRRLSLTVGGRAFLTNTDVASRAAAGLAVANFTRGVRAAGFAPKVVLAYQATDHVLAYVLAAEGYRAGGINTSGLPQQVFSDPGGPEPNREYRGDRLWNFEAGVRLGVLDDQLSIRSALYAAEWRNIQSDQLLSSGLPFTANIGNGGSRGFEVEGRYRRGAFSAGANLLLNDPELRHANPAFPARPELGLAGSPSAMGAVMAHDEWTISAGVVLGIDARVAYVGSSHLTFDEKTSPRMPAYATARVAATVRRGSWRVTAAIDNPADVHADTFAYGNPFTLRVQRQSTPLRPTTLSLRISRSWP